VVLQGVGDWGSGSCPWRGMLGVLILYSSVYWRLRLGMLERVGESGISGVLKVWLVALLVVVKVLALVQVVNSRERVALVRGV